VSISPTFYAQLFCTKVFRAAFLYLWLRFVLFWRKEIGTKAACKMLVKLTKGHNSSPYISKHESSIRTFFISLPLMPILSTPPPMGGNVQIKYTNVNIQFFFLWFSMPLQQTFTLKDKTEF